MSDDHLPVRRVEHVPAPPIDVTATPLPAHDPLLRKIHRTLRGRYPWAVVLGLIGAVGGGYAGWKAQRPVYRAEGLISIAASMPSPQDPVGMNVLPLFSRFVALQEQLLGSPTVTQLAMETAAWRATGGRISPETMEAFVKSRAIIHPPDALHILVTFEDPSPATALAGVRAILSAYEALSQEQNAQDERLRRARDKADSLAIEMQASANNVIRLASQHGSVEVLAMRHRAACERELAAENALAELQAAIRAKEGTETQVEPLTDMTSTEIAWEDADMRVALEELERLVADEAVKSETMGDANVQLAELRREIALRRAWIDRFAHNWNLRRSKKTPTGVSLEDLKKQEAAREALLASAAEGTRELGSLLAEINKAQAKTDELRREHTQMIAYRDYLEGQLVGQGRITIADRGRLPMYPFKDRRRMTAAMGGMLGAFLAVLLVVLLARRDRRLRDTDDVGNALSRLRLLGLMPQIPDDLSEPAGAEVAAHCVHQIRTLLQIRRPTTRGASFCMTGPGVGTGKTTLSLALALSFARSGTRTLLIDADLTGRGLTRRMGALGIAHTRRLLDGDGASNHPADTDRHMIEPLVQGEARQGSPTLDTLLSLLTDTIERLGPNDPQTPQMIENIFAAENLLFRGRGREELIAHLTTLTGTQRRGTSMPANGWVPAPIKELDAQAPEMNGTPLERYLHPMGLKNLQFLPLRGLGRGGAVSAAAIEKLLARATGEFDIVLIDTGPVLGSIEAPILAAATDGTVVVLSPNDQRPDAERAVSHLEHVGADLRGIVFNRAALRDVLKTSRSRSSVERPEDHA